MSDVAAIIANCGAFQEAAGVTDAEGAAEFVHYPLQEYGVPNKFPFAVMTPQGHSEERLAGNCHLPSGTIRLFLGRVIVDSKADHKEAEIEFANFAGAVIESILDASGEGGHFVWLPEQIAPPSRTEAQHDCSPELPAFYEVAYDLQWSAL